jgi:hypothetical protein
VARQSVLVCAGSHEPAKAACRTNRRTSSDHMRC